MCQWNSMNKNRVLGKFGKHLKGWKGKVIPNYTESCKPREREEGKEKEWQFEFNVASIQWQSVKGFE